jgi:hypothetical protein
MRFTRGLHFLFAVVTCRSEDHLAPHAFLENLLHLVADLPTDSQKVLEAHKPWSHDLHHLSRAHEGVLIDGIVDGESKLFW